MNGSQTREWQRADDFIERYVRWREASAEVRAAYARWGDCPPEWRQRAFEGYLAALEREQHAATVYAAYTRVLRSSSHRTA